jgi:hypothetical protein
MDKTHKARSCSDCNKPTPTTETNYTLISSRHGWRLEITIEPGTGQRVTVWRCPDCWKWHKVSRAATAP